MNKKRETQRGITLIALVVTIIVMMILVGVTISMSINGGLFTKAGEATGKMNNALKAEQLLADGKIEVNGVVYDSIDDYLAGKKATVAPTSITISGGISVNVRRTITLEALNQANQKIPNEEFEWTSSNTGLATVNDKGVVSGGSVLDEDGVELEETEVTITAKYKKNNAIVATKTITVNPLVCPCCEGTGEISAYHIICDDCSYVVDLTDYDNEPNYWMWESGSFKSTGADYECLDCGHWWQSLFTDSCPKPECGSSNIEVIIYNGDITWPCGHVDTFVSEETYGGESIEPGDCEYCNAAGKFYS